MKNINKKEILLVLISFLIGVLVCLFIKEDKEDELDFQKVIDSCIYIETYKNNNKSSEGSGFIYKIDTKYAYILTNEHVIIGDTIKIKNNKIEKEATLLGSDEYLDLAVLRVDKKKISNKLILSNKSPQIGEEIYVVGNPLGENYIGTVTKGILSGKDRLVKTEIDEETPIIMGVMQIDAAINHGSSGSPLINKNGEVIGIVTLKLIDEEIEGMGFAIPISEVKKYLKDLENNKEIKYTELGIKVTSVSNSSVISSNEIEIPSSVREGVVVLNVTENSLGDKANLKKGDIIVNINNVKISDTISLKYELSKYKKGDTLKIKYLRNNKEKSKTIKIDS